MKLRSRLIILGVLPLVLSISIIAYMIFQIVNIQSSAKDDVNVLTATESLNGSLLVTKQAMANYAFNSSDANKSEALSLLNATEAEMKNLEQLLKNEREKATLSKAAGKFTELKRASEQALASQNTAEAKRQSIRVSGVLNDMHLLNKQTNEWYEGILKQTEQKITFIILSSVIASALIILMSIVLSLFLSNRIVKPINAIVKDAARVADGDLTIQPAATSKNSKYEIDNLQNSFSDMVQNLRQTVLSVESIGGRVKTFTDEVNVHMQSLTESSNQVAVSTEELSRGSQSISEDISSTAELMNSMGEEFGKNVEESNLSVKSSKAALDMVHTGKTTLNKQKAFSEQQSQSSQDIMLSVEQFAKYTDEIEQAATSVKSIADQTNLLALNAAIEAARAGEAGKGFAVVAEEVRKLAEDSSQATELIGKMVHNIKDGIGSIIDLTNKGNHLSQEQLSSMNETEAAFENISDKISLVYNQLNSLVDGMNQSNEMTAKVISAVENISAVTEETAAGTEEISASTEEQLNFFNQMNAKIGQLHQMTEEMNEELNKFKL
ncbi:methyl-accepting chemotaxis protein [Bacillus sp. SG-1]|uniref:methyl-accepting chemotaxis protein n=1 Tax=Bacillus sp. SG-1 TaxID=161544 RepID=UPI00015443AE|nr:methyl-accepting chemotaxis protein [Bacillus sp. SG-1]EDL65205.1 Methyl-accepting chemotaxis protein [Bacillus sp. SG-1]